MAAARRRNQLAVRLSQPVSFAWDLPDGPLQQALAPVIGVRRLLAQADAEAHGSLLEILDDRGKTVARLRIESGQVRLPMARSAWQPLPTIVTLTGLRGYEDVYGRLVPVIESRPGITSCPEGLHGVMLRQVGAPEPATCHRPAWTSPPTVRADVGARQIHRGAARASSSPTSPVFAPISTRNFSTTSAWRVRRTRSLLGQIRHVFPPDVVRAFLDRVLVDRPPHRPAARHGRARPRAQRAPSEIFLLPTWKR